VQYVLTTIQAVILNLIIFQNPTSASPVLRPP